MISSRLLISNWLNWFYTTTLFPLNLTLLLLLYCVVFLFSCFVELHCVLLFVLFSCVFLCLVSFILYYCVFSLCVNPHWWWWLWVLSSPPSSVWVHTYTQRCNNAHWSRIRNLTAALDTDPDAWSEVNEIKSGLNAQSNNTICTQSLSSQTFRGMVAAKTSWKSSSAVLAIIWGLSTTISMSITLPSELVHVNVLTQHCWRVTRTQ